jgi:hypothetical protein
MRLLATVLVVLAVAAAAAGASTGPRIALLDTSPLTVAGAGFGSRTGVHVTVTLGRTRLAKQVGSTRSGRFVARFTRSLPDPSCAQLTITAASVRTRLTVKIVPASDTCGAQRVTSDPAPPAGP